MYLNRLRTPGRRQSRVQRNGMIDCLRASGVPCRETRNSQCRTSFHMSNSDEKEFRLRPRKPPAPRRQNEALVWALAFKRVMHYARMNRRVPGPKSRRVTRLVASSTNQRRAALRHVLAKRGAGTNGGAHGCRACGAESATPENDLGGAGFDNSDHGVDIAARLEEWQSARWTSACGN